MLDWIAIGLDLWASTFWETVEYPLDPQQVKPVAEGSTATKPKFVKQFFQETYSQMEAKG